MCTFKPVSLVNCPMRTTLQLRLFAANKSKLMHMHDYQLGGRDCADERGRGPAVRYAGAHWRAWRRGQHLAPVRCASMRCAPCSVWNVATKPGMTAIVRQAGRRRQHLAPIWCASVCCATGWHLDTIKYLLLQASDAREIPCVALSHHVLFPLLACLRDTWPFIG